ELVQQKYVRRGVALHASLDGRNRFLFKEVGERGIDAREADGPSGFEGTLPEILSERALADAARSPKKHVLTACGEGERQELFIARAIDRAREAPIESVERLHCAKGRLLRSRGEVSGVAFAPLEEDDLLD